MEEHNANIQIGGPGVEVEMDEVCYRARWTTDADGTDVREWVRYIAAYERGTGSSWVSMGGQPGRRLITLWRRQGHTKNTIPWGGDLQ